MSSIADLLRLYAQQFEDQHAPQNMTIALREASSLLEKQFDAIKTANEETERLRAALEGVVREWEDYYGEFGDGDVPFVVGLTMVNIACVALDEGKTND